MLQGCSVSASAFSVKPPQKDGAGEAFDGGIEAESEQGNTAGEHADGERNSTFREVPSDGQILERYAAADMIGSGEGFSGHSEMVARFRWSAAGAAVLVFGLE